MTAEVPQVLVAVAEDDLAEKVSASLERAGMKLSARARTRKDAVEIALLDGVNGCIIEIALPGSGLTAATEIRQHRPDVGVAMVGDDDTDLLCDAVLAGARGYFVPPLNESVMVEQFRMVLAGRPALTERQVEALVAQFEVRERERQRRAAIRELLTDREIEVLEKLSGGASTRSIAEELFISPVTVRSHVAALTSKLGVEDREAAVAYFERLAAGPD